MPKIDLIHGDSLLVLPTLPANSFDVLITDPPAGIAHMDAAWDDFGGRSGFIAFIHKIFTEVFRVLKPGAWGLVWSLPRSAHWTATGIEEAGFEIRDFISHVTATGLNKHPCSLKPAQESWWLIRKPAPSAERIQPLNLEECRAQGRIPSNFSLEHTDQCVENGIREIKGQKTRERTPDPISKTGWGFKRQGGIVTYPTDEDGYEVLPKWICAPGCPVDALNLQVDDGDRFFFVAKPDKEERHLGCQDLYWQRTPGLTGLESRVSYTPTDFVTWAALPDDQKARGNIHLTPKPIALLRHFVKLICPPLTDNRSCQVLDCFGGSGSTALACELEGVSATLIERDETFVLISQKRLDALRNRMKLAATRAGAVPSEAAPSESVTPPPAQASLLPNTSLTEDRFRQLVRRSAKKH